MKIKVYLYSLIFVLIASVSVINTTFGQCSGSDVSVSYSSRCLPSLVTYYVTPALPTGSVYYWDLGDGKGPILGADTFYHQFTTGGSFGITVTVIKPDGTKCVISKAKGFVVFNIISNPGFYADQTKICSLPAVISLHDTTANVVTRDWYINSVLYPKHSVNITVTDSIQGNISISMVVYDKYGCSASVIKQNYINFLEFIPVNFCAVLTEDISHSQISAKYKIGFDTSGYGITEFDWSFPSGNPLTYSGITPPSITYTNLSGFYDVSLSIKTKSGCIATYSKSKLVGKYYSIPQQTLCASSKGVISYLAPIASGRLNRFIRIKMDKPGTITYDNSQNQAIIHFLDTGYYQLKFPIYYFNSVCNDSLIVPDLFKILPPIADFSIDPGVLCNVPGKVNFHVNIGNSATVVNSYLWQIFDSSMTQIVGSPLAPKPGGDTSFNFTKNGLYSIKLIANNKNGCSDTVLYTNILRTGTPDINYRIIHDTLCIGDTMYINNLSNMKDVPGNALRYSWTLTNNDSSDIIIQSSLRSPRIVFAYPGKYKLNYTIQSQTCQSSQGIPNAVTVNGVSANIQITQNKTCTPVTYSFKSVINSNVPSNSPITYFWSVTPPGNVTINNPDSASTDVVFNKQGYYNILLKISNGFCTDVIRKDSISIGTIASFKMDSLSCRFTPVVIINQSSENANRFKWIISPSSGYKISSDTAKNPSLSFTSSGCFRVLLQTSDTAVPGCIDTFSQAICINKPPVILKAFSPDTSSHCTPQIDSFYVNSMNGNSYYWDFGDSSHVISNDSQLTHAYFKNNSSGYTIKVVAIDGKGCTSDTFILKNYIKISGPEPAFSVVSKPPCDSGTVFFVNNSKFVYNYYFIYGDNSNTDNDTIRPHFYKYEDFSKDSNIYNPTLYAYDETGCLASATSTVKLYRPPVVKIFASDTAGCAPLSVTFTDSTKYAIKFKWNFDDGNTDTIYSPSHVFISATAPGTIYNVTLTAVSDKGCTVTSAPIQIDVHPVVVPTITINGPKIECYQDTFHFMATTSSPVSKYMWKFGDGNLNSDTSSEMNPAYHYTFFGKHRVVLTVFTKFGCTSQVMDSTTINTLDSISPVAPKIDYITVTPTNQVKIVFAKSISNKFDHYTLYRFPGPDSIYATSNVNDTVYYDNPPIVNVQNQYYTYTLKLTDECGFSSSFSLPHHSILLSVNKIKKNTLGLEWNKYSGWDSVKYYQIFRKDSKGKFILIGTVGPLDSTFLDSNLCPGRNTYYVYAVNTNGMYFSASDTSSNIPDYQYQSIPLVLAKATVLNNKFVYINWVPTIQSNFKFYSIDKYSANTGWVLNFASTVKTFYIDSSVDVNNYEYIYRVSTVDNCGNVSPESNISTSILLKSIVINDTRYLSWNAYSDWNRGISSYHLQIIQNDGSYKDLVILSSTDTTYFDSASHQELDVQTCYRVYAVENPDLNGNLDSSLSNITCPYLPPRIYIPNAFTPNNDSVNDVFIPIGLSIINNTEVKAQKYEFRIYNKWGELMFETNDTRKGWDGKYKGAFVPSDVYIYVVDAQGFNGQRFYLKGNVTVVK